MYNSQGNNLYNEHLDINHVVPITKIYALFLLNWLFVPILLYNLLLLDSD